VAQRVLASLAPPILVNEHELDVTASMGISVFPDGGSAAEELLKNADRAMYSAKRAGRNTYSLQPRPDATFSSTQPPAFSSSPPGSSAFPVSGIAAAGSNFSSSDMPLPGSAFPLTNAPSGPSSFPVTGPASSAPAPAARNLPPARSAANTASRR
jgi:hypothetical protein